MSDYGCFGGEAAELVATTLIAYHPRATRTNRAELPMTFELRHCLTDPGRTDSPRRASTALWMSRARMDSRCSMSTQMTASKTQSCRRCSEAIGRRPASAFRSAALPPPSLGPVQPSEQPSRRASRDREGLEWCRARSIRDRSNRPHFSPSKVGSLHPSLAGHVPRPRCCFRPGRA